MNLPFDGETVHLSACDVICGALSILASVVTILVLI